MSTTIQNNNISDDSTFVIEPVTYEPTVGPKPGRFVDMSWDTTPKKNDAPPKDLVLVVELEEKDDSGSAFQIKQAFNMLPGGRGKAEFKKQMNSWREKPLTPGELAKLKKEIVVGKPVIVNYKTDHLSHIVFDKYLPAKAAQPITAAA
jgi:hypothetical protein